MRVVYCVCVLVCVWCVGCAMCHLRFILRVCVQYFCKQKQLGHSLTKALPVLLITTNATEALINCMVESQKHQGSDRVISNFSVCMACATITHYLPLASVKTSLTDRRDRISFLIIPSSSVCMLEGVLGGGVLVCMCVCVWCLWVVFRSSFFSCCNPKEQRVASLPSQEKWVSADKFGPGRGWVGNFLPKLKIRAKCIRKLNNQHMCILGDIHLHMHVSHSQGFTKTREFDTSLLCECGVCALLVSLLSFAHRCIFAKRC